MPKITDFSVTLLRLESYCLEVSSLKRLPRKFVETESNEIVFDDLEKDVFLHSWTFFKDVLHDIVSILIFKQLDTVFDQFLNYGDNLEIENEKTSMSLMHYLCLRFSLEDLLYDSASIWMERESF